MDDNLCTPLNNDNYVEAETVSEDSENSSLSNNTDGTSEVSPFLDGIQKVKNLIKELEQSFHDCNNISNNLLLHCILLRAKNQNLIYKIKQGKSCASKAHKSLELSVLNENTNDTLNKCQTNDKEKQLMNVKTDVGHSMAFDTSEEIDLLHNTIGDLQKKLRERNAKFDDLYKKYSSLQTNKIKMESDLRSQITSLEEQLNITYDTFIDFRNETEADIEQTLSSAIDTQEALFLQEKLRCSKLMYEKIRLHHEIQRLQDVIRRQTSSHKEKDHKHWSFTEVHNRQNFKRTFNEALMDDL